MGLCRSQVLIVRNFRVIIKAQLFVLATMGEDSNLASGIYNKDITLAGMGRRRELQVASEGAGELNPLQLVIEAPLPIRSSFFVGGTSFDTIPQSSVFALVFGHP